MLKAESVQMRLDQFWRQFAIGCLNGDEAAAYYALRCAAFVNVDMGCRGAYHSLVRAQHCIEAQGVATRTVKGEEHTSPFAKEFLELRFGSVAVFVIAIRQCVFVVRFCYCLQHLRTNARVVVASKSSFQCIMIFIG